MRRKENVFDYELKWDVRVYNKREHRSHSFSYHEAEEDYEPFE